MKKEHYKDRIIELLNDNEITKEQMALHLIGLLDVMIMVDNENEN